VRKLGGMKKLRTVIGAAICRDLALIHDRDGMYEAAQINPLLKLGLRAWSGYHEGDWLLQWEALWFDADPPETRLCSSPIPISLVVMSAHPHAYRPASL